VAKNITTFEYLVNTILKMNSWLMTGTCNSISYLINFSMLIAGLCSHYKS